ncbi:MAG: hypothetical protein AAF546_14070 [Verrucomicrobiota bacterium]
MKNKILLILVPVLCLTLGTGRAAADDEGWYALGGFVGGVVATKVFDHHKGHHHHVRSHHSGPQCNKHCSSCKSYKPSGYYKTVRVKVWVPGYWETYYDRCGRRQRHFVSGHHTYEKQRVWVSNEKKYHNNYKRYSGNQYAYRR